MAALNLEFRKRVSGSFDAALEASKVYVKTHVNQVVGLLDGTKISAGILPKGVYDGMHFIDTISTTAHDTTAELQALVSTASTSYNWNFAGCFFIATTTLTVTVSTGHHVRDKDGTDKTQTQTVTLSGGDWILCQPDFGDEAGVSTGTTWSVIDIGHVEATTSVAGHMSAADKTKLDGLVTNATHTGDVTGSGALTIAAGAVTLTKMANLAANSIIGNNTAGATTPIALTPTQVRTLLNVADGANNYVHPNHSGDVTSVADGAQTIAAGAVTLSKMAYLAANSIIGNNTASAATPLALTAAQVRALLNVADGANNYVHPTSYTVRNIDTSGVDVLDTFTSDNNGHVTGITTRTLPNATTGAPGVMSATDKTKLDGVATGATANTKASSNDVTTGTDDNNFLTVVRGKQLVTYYSGITQYGTIAADLTTANAAHPDGAIVMFTS